MINSLPGKGPLSCVLGIRQISIIGGTWKKHTLLHKFRFQAKNSTDETIESGNIQIIRMF